MSAITVQQMADRVAGLMEDRLRVRGGGLAEKLKRGGRALPHKVRHEAEYLAKAAALAQIPSFWPRSTRPPSPRPTTPACTTSRRWAGGSGAGRWSAASPPASPSA